MALLDRMTLLHRLRQVGRYFLSRNTISPLILIAVSVVWWWGRGWIGFEWPSVDMLPSLTHFLHPSLLTNDFFTLASTHNPRCIFLGVLIGVSRLMRLDALDTLWVVKGVIVMLTPVALHRAMLLMTLPLAPQRRPVLSDILVLGISLVILQPHWSTLFTIGGWPPLMFQATAHAFAFMLGLFGICSVLSNTKWQLHLGTILFALSTLIHPTIGALVVLFFGLSQLAAGSVSPFTWRNWVVFSAAVVFPVGLLFFLFKALHPLPSQEFVSQYVLARHPCHYRPTQYVKIFFLSWLQVLTGIVLSLVGLATNAYFRRQWPLFRFSIGAALVISFGYALQYWGVEILGNKSIAIFGPSRIGAFTYWLWLMAFAVAMASRDSDSAPPLEPPSLHLGIVSIAVLLIAGLGIRTGLNPGSRDERSYDLPFYEWIDRSTSVNDVFAVPFWMATMFRSSANRAVLASDDFPFNEDYFHEFCDRKQTMLAIGTYFKMAGPPPTVRYRFDYLVLPAETPLSPARRTQIVYHDAQVLVLKWNPGDPIKR